jgi:ATP-binding cassette subfamily F protein 3
VAPGPGGAKHAETDESATDFVLGGDTRLIELREALARAEAAHDADMDNTELGMEIAHLHSDLADAGEHDAVPARNRSSSAWGSASAELDQPVNSFSGGWRMRLQLARALMCPSTCCCWTSHQPPGPGRPVWLEAWLKRYGRPR